MSKHLKLLNSLGREKRGSHRKIPPKLDKWSHKFTGAGIGMEEKPL
jgi:hypothetical protein